MHPHLSLAVAHSHQYDLRRAAEATRDAAAFSHRPQFRRVRQLLGFARFIPRPAAIGRAAHDSVSVTQS